MKFFSTKPKNPDRLVVLHCKGCNKGIKPEMSYKRIGRDFFCSVECLKNNPEYQTQEERFRIVTNRFNEEPLNYKKKRFL